MSEIPPKLALISDLTGFGRCSLAVAVPVVSIMRVQACPVPTSVYSNHMGFPSWTCRDLTSFLPSFFEEWEKQGLTFDGILCGFLANEEQISVAARFLEAHPEATVILDPVLGDHGKRYASVTAAHCQKMKQLASHADILTPNLTEACLLADVPYREEGWTQEALCGLADGLHALGPSRIAVTGIREPGFFLNFVSLREVSRQEPVHAGEPFRSLCRTPEAGRSRPGTGDIFAAIVAAGTLRGYPLENCVQKAASFVGACTEGSDRAGIPTEEGVLLENYLYLLHDSFRPGL